MEVMGLLGAPTASNTTFHGALHQGGTTPHADAPSQLPADTGHGIISPALELRQLHEELLCISQGSGSTWISGTSTLGCFILGYFFLTAVRTADVQPREAPHPTWSRELKLDIKKQ